MASRRPPLFELLQQDDASRQGRGSGSGRSGALGGSSPEKPGDKPGPAPANGASASATSERSGSQAEGAVETKPLPASKPADKKSTLDELAESAPPTREATKPALKPMPKPQPEAAPRRASEDATDGTSDRPTGAADWSGMHPKKSVRVPMFWVYGGAIAVVAIIAGVWVGGYQLGVSSEREKVEQFLGNAEQRGPIVDPIGTEQPAGIDSERSPLAGLQTPQERETERQAADTPARQPVTQPEPEPVRPATAAMVDVTLDIREAGNNYLKLASGMTLDRAKGLAQHLTTNGIHAMAIQEGQGYGLYTAYPVPSGQYRAMGQQRRDLEARVVQLLGTVPQEAGGPYTPRDQLWMRFDG